MDLSAIQSALESARVDAWLFYDHHHRDPLAAAILGLPDHGLVSRRWYYVIPAAGRAAQARSPHRSRQAGLAPRLQRPFTPRGRNSSPASKPCSVPGNASPCSTPRATPSCTSPWSTRALSNCSASVGKEIVSSADLVSRFQAVLTEEQIDSHYAAQKLLDDILVQGFQTIGSRARAGDARHRIRNDGAGSARRWTAQASPPTTAPMSPSMRTAPIPITSPRAESSRPIRLRLVSAHRYLGARESARHLLVRHHLDRSRQSRANRTGTRRSSLSVATRAMPPLKQSAPPLPTEAIPSPDSKPTMRRARVIRNAGYAAVLHPSHRPQHRHRTPRQRRAP